MTRDVRKGHRVLHVYHSGLVAEWQGRDRALRDLGDEVALICAQRWNEGGAIVQLAPDGDAFVTGVRTFGHHPNLFFFDPVALWRALRTTPIDVLDIHEEPVSVAAAEVQLVALAAGRHVPFCLYSAQNIEKRYPVPFRWIEQIALRRATAVHTCNEAAGRILRRKGFRGIVVNLGLGIDVDRFASGTLCDSSTALRVGYVGRLAPHKGVLELIKAVTRVAECRLDIWGDGPDRGEVDHCIRNSGAADRITMKGFVSHASVPRVYAELDVLAVPSLETPSWIEQFGRVAVEAMASGVPVVASDTGSLPEVIGDGGLLVPPGDIAALAGALERLMQDPAERARLGDRGREQARRFSWANIARHQHELYAEMVSR